MRLAVRPSNLLPVCVPSNLYNLIQVIAALATCANGAWTKGQKSIKNEENSTMMQKQSMFHRGGYRPSVELSFSLSSSLGSNTFSHTGDMVLEATLANTGTEDLYFVDYDSPFTDLLTNNVFKIKPKKNWVYLG